LKAKMLASVSRMVGIAVVFFMLLRFWFVRCC